MKRKMQMFLMAVYPEYKQEILSASYRDLRIQYHESKVHKQYLDKFKKRGTGNPYRSF